MSIVSDGLRPFWLPRIQSVVGRPQKGFAEFILDQTFQIYNTPTTRKAELSVADTTDVLRAFAFDITRFLTASIETVAEDPTHAKLPKSTAWLLIRSYYAAFFAAHGIARMLGVTYTRFDSRHSKSVNEIAALFAGSDQVPPRIQNGLYRCEVIENTKTIVCELLGDTGGGSHEAFWSSFAALLREKSDALLASSAGLPESNQAAAQSLDELLDVLNKRGLQGTWLSFTRNAINYQQAMGCWFPYTNAAEKSLSTIARAEKWLDDVTEINLSAGKEELPKFQGASLYLVSLAREMAIDMASRAPNKGKSFHNVGVLSLLKQL